MNSNFGPMLAKNRHIGRRGYWCNCIHCHDADDYKNNGFVRAREKKSWKKDQGV
jgi:hypothetical protein